MRLLYFRHLLRRRERGLALLAGALLLTLALAVSAARRLQPILERLAVSRATNMVNRIVSEAVNEAIERGDVQYSEMIALEKDREGHITAIHSNMAVCNRLKVEILNLILSRIDQVSARELSIPVGTLTGSPLLAGRGPRISVRMESVGSSEAWFENAFTSAGINQTNHQILLHIDVAVALLLPGTAASATVSNTVTVAETVIVGEVPQTYTYFATDAAHAAEDQKDYILNNA